MCTAENDFDADPFTVDQNSVIGVVSGFRYRSMLWKVIRIKVIQVGTRYSGVDTANIVYPQFITNRNFLNIYYERRPSEFPVPRIFILS